MSNIGMISTVMTCLGCPPRPERATTKATASPSAHRSNGLNTNAIYPPIHPTKVTHTSPTRSDGISTWRIALQLAGLALIVAPVAGTATPSPFGLRGSEGRRELQATCGLGYVSASFDPPLPTHLLEAGESIIGITPVSDASGFISKIGIQDFSKTPVGTTTIEFGTQYRFKHPFSPATSRASGLWAGLIMEDATSSRIALLKFDTPSHIERAFIAPESPSGAIPKDTLKITETPDGGILLLGRECLADQCRGVVAKMDGSYRGLWRLDLPTNAYPKGMSVFEDHIYTLSQSQNSGLYYSSLSKISSEGQIEWTTQIPETFQLAHPRLGAITIGATFDSVFAGRDGIKLLKPRSESEFLYAKINSDGTLVKTGGHSVGSRYGSGEGSFSFSIEGTPYLFDIYGDVTRIGESGPEWMRRYTFPHSSAEKSRFNLKAIGTQFLFYLLDFNQYYFLQKATIATAPLSGPAGTCERAITDPPPTIHFDVQTEPPITPILTGTPTPWSPVAPSMNQIIKGGSNIAPTPSATPAPITNPEGGTVPPPQTDSGDSTPESKKTENPTSIWEIIGIGLGNLAGLCCLCMCCAGASGRGGGVSPSSETQGGTSQTESTPAPERDWAAEDRERERTQARAAYDEAQRQLDTARQWPDHYDVGRATQERDEAKAKKELAGDYGW